MNERKMAMQITRLGYGIHRERFFLYYSLKNETTVSEETLRLIQKIADSHYEADFVIGSTSDKIDHKLQLDEDNIYLVPNLSDENDQFLNETARFVITEEIFNSSNLKELNEDIIKKLARENFKRDETTKQAKFKISTSHAGTDTK